MTDRKNLSTQSIGNKTNNETPPPFGSFGVETDSSDYYNKGMYDYSALVTPGQDFGIYTNTNNILEEDGSMTNAENQRLVELLTSYDKAIEGLNQVELKITETLKFAENAVFHNQYAGQNVTFNSGENAYVTKQGVVKLYPNSKVLKKTAGFNSCPPNNPQKINVKLKSRIPGSMTETNPKLLLGTNMSASQSCGYEGQNVYVDRVLTNPKSTSKGCYNSPSSAKPLLHIQSGVPVDFSTCQYTAVNTGNRYFGLTNITDFSTGTGFCAVGNGAGNPNPKIYQKDPMYAVSTHTVWKAEYKGPPIVKSVTIGYNGEMNLNDSNGRTLFAYGGYKQGGGFIGCAADNHTRALKNVLMWDGKSIGKEGQQARKYDHTSCQNAAIKNGYQYFGIQWNNGNLPQAECWMSNDSRMGNENTFIFGKSNNCWKLSDGNPVGGGWANAVYSVTNPNLPFYLLLTNTSMGIYKGENPQSNPPLSSNLIWSTPVFKGVASPNPDFSSKSIAAKYPRNYLVAGRDVLNQGEFIGSPDGSVYLTLDKNGLLSVVTSVMQSKCERLGTTEEVGSISGAFEIYDLGSTGYPKNMGKIGYIDSNGQLSEYPKSMLNGSKIKVLPPGVDPTINNIDSVQYQRYNKGKKMSPNYKPFWFSKLTDIQKSQLEQAQGTLNLASQNLFGYISELQHRGIAVSNQVVKNNEFINKSALEILFNQEKIKEESTQNLEVYNQLLNDNDLLTISKNYTYLVWSILALGVVIVSINATH